MDSQDQGHMYFTNLLSQESQLNPTYVEQNGMSPVSIDDSPTLPPNNPTDAKKSMRGINFTHEEDKLLVSGWLNCSLDAIHGTDQKFHQLWEKIFDYFQQHKVTTTERTVKSLIHRWQFIQKATNKFCAKLAQVKGLNQSGMTEQDKLVQAKIMYSELEKCNFQFEHCWHMLKDQPKWISLCTTKGNANKRKTMLTSSRDDSVFDLEKGDVIKNDVIELDRPMGVKAEKNRKAQSRQQEENCKLRKLKYTLLEESCAQEKEYYRLKAEKIEYDKEKEEKQLRLEDERLRLEVEKMELAKKESEQRIKESDQRIMMMDVSAMPEMQRLYFQELQKEIMIRLGQKD